MSLRLEGSARAKFGWGPRPQNSGWAPYKPIGTQPVSGNTEVQISVRWLSVDSEGPFGSVRTTGKCPRSPADPIWKRPLQSSLALGIVRPFVPRQRSSCRFVQPGEMRCHPRDSTNEGVVPRWDCWYCSRVLLRHPAYPCIPTRRQAWVSWVVFPPATRTESLPSGAINACPQHIRWCGFLPKWFLVVQARGPLP